MTKTALITGASGGLGLSFVKVFAKEGYDLVIVARNTQRLESIKADTEAEFGVNVKIVSKDLTNENAPHEIFLETEKENIKVDVLVNNAGFGDFGKFADSCVEKQSDMIALNVSSLVKLTHFYLKDMIERGSGRILNVASIAAFQPGPLMSVYYATKAFVLSFSEALAVETKGTGVKITALCPGPIKTDFEKRADLEESGLFKNLKVWSPDVIAKFGYKKMMQNKTVCIKGGLNKLITFSSRLAPRALVRNSVYQIQKPKK